LAPEYDAAADDLAKRGSTAKLAKIDATQNKDIAKRHGVKGYPTLIVFQGGKPQPKYTGARTSAAIADHLAVLAGGSVGAGGAPPAGAASGDGVLVLTEDNFDETLARFSPVMVKFYAPWCGHCKKLAPEYEKAAFMLRAKGSRARLAKMDATAFPAVGKAHGVEGFPTLKVFVDGAASDLTFNRQRTAVEVANFMRKAAGEAEDVEASSGFGDGSMVMEMTWGTAERFMKLDVKRQILVCDDLSDDARRAELVDDLKFAAEELDNQFVVAYLDSTNPENAKIVERVGGRLSQCPLLRFADLTEGFKVWQPPRKHRKKYAADADGIVAFASAWSAGKLTRYLRSQPIPPPSQGAVSEIVGKTFQATVVDSDEDVLLFMYMSGCKFCAAFREHFEEVAEEMASDALRFVTMNGPRNDIDHPNVGYKAYPHVLFFPAGDKSNPIKFDETHGDEAGEALREFLGIFSQGGEAGEDEGDEPAKTEL
jgi:protein disulfide-isomerase-like protein